MVGNNGDSWIQLRTVAEGQPYLVLDSAGEIVGRIMFPRRTMVAAADNSSVWTMEFDVYDVPSLVKYGLRL